MTIGFPERKALTRSTAISSHHLYVYHENLHAPWAIDTWSYTSNFSRFLVKQNVNIVCPSHVHFDHNVSIHYAPFFLSSDLFTYWYSLALCPYVHNFFCVPMSPVSYLYLISYFLNLWHNTVPWKSSELNTTMQFLKADTAYTLYRTVS